MTHECQGETVCFERTPELADSPLAPCSLHIWEKVPTEHMWQNWEILQRLRDPLEHSGLAVLQWRSGKVFAWRVSKISRSYAEVPSLLLGNRMVFFIFLFFGPLPGHRVVQWVPSTSRGVSMVWMDYALIQVWEEIQWGSEYEEHTVMNPVLNWIMICVFTDDSDTFFFVLVFQLFIKLQSRYELINNLTTLTPLCSSRMNFQDYLPVKMINDLKLVLRIHPCRSWC